MVWFVLLWAGWNLDFSGKLSSHVTLNLSMCSKKGDKWNYILHGRDRVIWDERAPVSVSTLFLRNRSNRASPWFPGLTLRRCSQMPSEWLQSLKVCMRSEGFVFSSLWQNTWQKHSIEGRLALTNDSEGSPSWQESMPKHGRSVWVFLFK